MGVTAVGGGKGATVSAASVTGRDRSGCRRAGVGAVRGAGLSAEAMLGRCEGPFALAGLGEEVDVPFRAADAAAAAVINAARLAASGVVVAAGCGDANAGEAVLLAGIG